MNCAKYDHEKRIFWKRPSGRGGNWTEGLSEKVASRLKPEE